MAIPTSLRHDSESSAAPATGVLYFSWVVAGAAFVAVVGSAYLKLVWTLPSPTCLLVIAAGIVNVGGALGVEMAGAEWAFHRGRQKFTYELLRDADEIMEMSGVLLFAYAPAGYVETHLQDVQVRLGR